MENEKFASAITSDPRWLSIVARDKEFDGKFFYSVKTTGGCRPSCGARLARPENVHFYTTTEAAEKAGFRACKWASPRASHRGQHGQDEKVPVIERSEETPPSRSLPSTQA
jgi:AraC family transcriptional regulator of adaptative response/methylated-DNA-[protein]-cysteine methyltransferase